MQCLFGEHFQCEQFGNEFNIAQHFLFGNVFSFFFVERIGRIIPETVVAAAIVSAILCRCARKMGLQDFCLFGYSFERIGN